MTTRAGRFAAFAALVINVTFDRLLDVVGGTPSVAAVSARYPTLFTPAGYAFAIWGLIYAAFFAYAVYQLMPSQAERGVHERLVRPFIAYNLLGALWLYAFRREWLAASVVVILGMLIAGAVMYVRAQRAVDSGELAGAWRFPFRIYLGWISVATIANVAVMLVSQGWRGGRWSEAAWAESMIGVAAVLGLAVGYRYRDPVYPSVIAWATAAIYVARRGEHPDVAAAAWTSAVVLLGWVVVLLVAKGRGDDGRFDRRIAGFSAGKGSPA